MSFREIFCYCEAQSIRILENLKQEIQVQEAVTDKLIGASITQKEPKVISLKFMFEKLFPEKIKAQSSNEQAKILRHIMKVEQMSNFVEK